MTTFEDQYRFLDCGDGRRLEVFGSLLLDRPAPGAIGPRRDPDRWAGTAVYHAGSGWRLPAGTTLPDQALRVRIAGLIVKVRPTASGAVGLFPEHAANADWLSTAVRARSSRPDRLRRLAQRPDEEIGDSGRTAWPTSVINLFGYTGLATLIAASAGAAVVHVDAARPAVQWARHNAELSGLADHPIRWIVDDALDFVRREARRGRRYAGLILDPPSYGHGGRGTRAWRFDDRIDELLDACAGIAEPDAFWLLTTHTPGWDPARLAATLGAVADAGAHGPEGIPLELAAESGAVLRLGAAARVDQLQS